MMMKRPGKQTPNFDEMEIQDWIESLDYVIRNRGAQRANVILDQLRGYALQRGVQIPFSANTPYINTIPLDQQPLYPGNGDIEQRIRSLVRWNALAMVVRANREESGIGGRRSSDGLVGQDKFSQLWMVIGVLRLNGSIFKSFRFRVGVGIERRHTKTGAGPESATADLM